MDAKLKVIMVVDKKHSLCPFQVFARSPPPHQGAGERPPPFPVPEQPPGRAPATFPLPPPTQEFAPRGQKSCRPRAMRPSRKVTPHLKALFEAILKIPTPRPKSLWNKSYGLCDFCALATPEDFCSFPRRSAPPPPESAR